MRRGVGGHLVRVRKIWVRFGRNKKRVEDTLGVPRKRCDREFEADLNKCADSERKV